MSLTTTGLSQSHKNTRARHVATPEYDDVTLNVRVFTPFCSPSCLSWSDDRRSVLTYVSGRAAGAGAGASVGVAASLDAAGRRQKRLHALDLGTGVPFCTSTSR